MGPDLLQVILRTCEVTCVAAVEHDGGTGAESLPADLAGILSTQGHWPSEGFIACIATTLHAHQYMPACTLVHPCMYIDTPLHARWYIFACKLVHFCMQIGTTLHAHRYTHACILATNASHCSQAYAGALLSMKYKRAGRAGRFAAHMLQGHAGCSDAAVQVWFPKGQTASQRNHLHAHANLAVDSSGQPCCGLLWPALDHEQMSKVA